MELDEAEEGVEPELGDCEEDADDLAAVDSVDREPKDGWVTDEEEDEVETAEIEMELDEAEEGVEPELEDCEEDADDRKKVDSVDRVSKDVGESSSCGHIARQRAPSPAASRIVKPSTCVM